MKRTMNRALCLLLTAVMAAGLLAGCGGSGDGGNGAVSTSGSGASGDGGSGSGGKEVVINLGMNSGWTDLVPYNQATGGNYSILVLTLLYDRLFYVDADGKICPRAAESWEISEDKLSCVFHLNPGAKWHDGEPVTAADYVFAVNMITDPDCGVTSKSHYYILTGTDTSGTADGTPLGVEALDDYTVKYTFDEPISQDVTFTLYLQAYMPLPEHLLRDVAPADYLSQDLWNHPIGSGPMKFESTIAGSELVLTANEDYYLGAPKFDKMRLQVMNADSSTAALISGDLDLIYPAPTKDNFKAMEAAGSLSCYYMPYASSQRCIYINNHVITDSRIRRAMDMAIDRESLAAMLEGTPIETPVTLASKYLDPSITYTYDPAAAKALLDEAIADGAYDPSQVITLVTGSSSEGENICSLVQQNLIAIGMNVEVQKMEAATMFAGFYDDTVTMGTVTKGSNLNPMYMRTSLTNKRTSYMQWPTDLWDDIAMEFMAAKDEDEEMAVMKKFQETWLEEVPSLFMVATYQNYAYSPRLGDGESLGIEYADLGSLPVWLWNVKS